MTGELLLNVLGQHKNQREARRGAATKSCHKSKFVQDQLNTGLKRLEEKPHQHHEQQRQDQGEAR
jgi:hypothetical protein